MYAFEGKVVILYGCVYVCILSVVTCAYECVHVDMGVYACVYIGSGCMHT